MQLFRAVAVLVAGALLVTACGQAESSDSSEDAGTALPLVELTGDDAMLTAAVERTNELDTFRFAMLVEMSVPDEDAIRIEIDGAVDVTRGNSSLTMNLESMFDAIPESERGEFEELFGDGTIEVVQSGSSAYVKFPSLAKLAGGGSDWVEIPVDASSDVLGLTGITFENPEDLLSGLSESGAVTDVGSQVLNGVDTTKFRLDPVETATGDDTSDIFGDAAFGSELFGGGSTFVWIDDHGVIRRMEINFNFFGIEGGIVVEFFDFGAPVVVDVPDDAVVIDPAQLELFG